MVSHPISYNNQSYNYGWFGMANHGGLHEVMHEYGSNHGDYSWLVLADHGGYGWFVMVHHGGHFRHQRSLMAPNVCGGLHFVVVSLVGARIAARLRSWCVGSCRNG